MEEFALIKSRVNLNRVNLGIALISYLKVGRCRYLQVKVGRCKQKQVDVGNNLQAHSDTADTFR